MGTELMRVCIKEDNDEFPSVPPGFESFTSFSLKRVNESEKQDSENRISCSETVGASESQSVQMETNIATDEVAKRSLRRRPWINHRQHDNKPEDEFNSELLEQNFALNSLLPKGVIRGCPQCSNCQKVSARWHPEDGQRPDLQDAPVFKPTEEEFNDTLNYIASIRAKAEPYGICRIVPPSSWRPPCPLKEKDVWETSKFATRVQRVDKLQNRDSMRKIPKNHNHMRKKRRRCTRMGADCPSGGRGSGDDGYCEAERFGFEPGPELTLETFERYADDFKTQYFSKNEHITDIGGNLSKLKEGWEPSVENIEGEYWRMVERPTEEIEVLYGADLETGVFGSGFPKMSSKDGFASEEQYRKSGWNLNNFPRLPGSVLSYESSDISGVLVPWLYVGMCFSSFCWHVEDHHLYSLNYMHWGAPKLWYGIPGSDAVKFEEAMRKHLPGLFEEQPDLLHKLVTQLSPSILKSEGVPVYRCCQNPGEFVLTFPRAYHSGFNCGFNCAEAVNVAPVDWLPHGQIAIELYQEQGRKTSISHDKLLLGAAREAVRAHWELNLLKKNSSDNLRWKDFCGKDGILAKALKARVEMERVRREFLCSSSQALKMDNNFDATSERECSICFFDLHLSAAGCHHCSPDRYACLNHAKKFCSCAWSAKFFLFRYDMDELNILLEALDGKLSAVYRWARLDLGLALSSYIAKDNMKVGNLSYSSRDAVLKEVSSQPQSTCFKDPLGTEISKQSPINPTGITGEISSQQNMKREESIFNTSKSRMQVCQLSQEDTSYAMNSDAMKSGMKMTSVENVILLSDDEGDEPKELPSKEICLATQLELSNRLVGSDGKVSPSNFEKEPILNTPGTDAAVMGEKVFSLPSGEKKDFSSHSVLVKDEQDNGGQLGSNPPNLPVKFVSIKAECGSNTSDISAHKVANSRSDPQHSQPCSSVKHENEDRHEKVGTNADTNLVDYVRTTTGSLSSCQNNLDRYFRQKGPRIAKVVRRISCIVEPLEFGVVLSGKSWCNSQAIFPKGFRSRVRHMSVLDPTVMCYYVSEVLDAGQAGPLFKVSLEHCPSEVFIHNSAGRCWEMVRERVNQEITRQHKLGRMNLPPLQPPGSLDGFEMFGFTSPAIVQAIEALDRNRVCSEYWDSRPYSRPQVQILQKPQSGESSENCNKMSKERNDEEAPNNDLVPTGVDTTLRGLLKKANLEELNSLYRILSDNQQTAGRGLVTRLLNEEIHSRST
ncbi:putative lysine-specific demethylase JMJ16 [Prunus avium]|uniref:Lysine-specific demethylase JMJ16 n=1 Tax=Prunus avium TaxID=42229 RepID=A0A6P5S953_PRUAV|nr:putative lysine-specific demethylase JMJ16 [Prunus avium]XP_021810980.1 putative lysine-specific demethylase JMJ16 [Prunus avium]XP_021810981.1 putative lysine-specific demethylase JMJ16 [Prunus avium]XP_021810982.1 putative lysine-specific demethylase JMJ16 [Prunus avium]XP_021810983.1 putative lysine-specific demethylase JMJ16 [Prunus avium]